jgi:glutaredoxin
MTSLLTRLLRPRRRADHLTFTVYTRRQCCCCHKALDLLRDHQRRHGFTIEEIDVDNDPALVEAHGLSVPVVAVGGKVRFRGVVNPVLLERLLDAEAAGREDR